MVVRRGGDGRGVRARREPGEGGAEVGRAPEPGPAARDVDHIGLQRVAAHRRQRSAARREPGRAQGSPSPAAADREPQPPLRVEPVQPARAVVRRRDRHDRPPGRALSEAGRTEAADADVGPVDDDDLLFEERHADRAGVRHPAPAVAPVPRAVGHATPPSPRSSPHSQGRSRAPWPGRGLQRKAHSPAPQAVARTAKIATNTDFRSTISRIVPKNLEDGPTPRRQPGRSLRRTMPENPSTIDRLRGLLEVTRLVRAETEQSALLDAIATRSRHRSDSTPSSSTSTGPPGTTSR